MDITFFVYLLTFANGKVYVGMSRTDSKGRDTNRYYQHANAARVGKQGFVYSAWRKHGPPVQTVLSAHVSRELCALAEIDAIQQYDSMNPAAGYNLAPGGEGMHAPVGSAMYELMRAKVWNNPETRSKISAALKGRPLPDATREAQLKWCRSDAGKAFIRGVTARPEVRSQLSASMTERLANGYREYLGDVQRGKPRKFTEKGWAARQAKRLAWLDSEVGKAALRAGCIAMRANPDNEAKRKAAAALYSNSATNKVHCAEMGAKSRKAVKDLATGEMFESRTAAAKARGVTGPTIGYWVKQGRFVYV